MKGLVTSKWLTAGIRRGAVARSGAEGGSPVTCMPVLGGATRTVTDVFGLGSYDVLNRFGMTARTMTRILVQDD